MHLGPLITYAVLRTTGKWKRQKRLPIIMRLENSVLCLVFNLIAMNTIMLTALTKIHQTSNWHQCVYIQQLLEGMLRLKLLQCVHKSWFRCCRISSECLSETPPRFHFHQTSLPETVTLMLCCQESHPPKAPIASQAQAAISLVLGRTGEIHISGSNRGQQHHFGSDQTAESLLFYE